LSLYVYLLPIKEKDIITKAPNRMKINQILLLLSVSALMSFTFGCAEENSNAEPLALPKVYSLSIYAAQVGTLITVNGSNLESLDSARLGKVNLSILNNSATSFKFNIPSNAISGKLYVYKGKTIDSSETLTIQPPQPRNLSPINAKIGEKVTIGGFYLGNLDSVKIGSLLVDTMQSNESSFSFRVTQSMFSGKIYLYRGSYLDSSLYITVLEPTGPVNEESISWAINGKSNGPGIGNFMGFRTINNVRMLNLWSYDVISSIEIDQIGRAHV